jgi:hypothetical protein
MANGRWHGRKCIFTGDSTGQILPCFAPVSREGLDIRAARLLSRRSVWSHASFLIARLRSPAGLSSCASDCERADQRHAKSQINYSIAAHRSEQIVLKHRVRRPSLTLPPSSQSPEKKAGKRSSGCAWGSRPPSSRRTRSRGARRSASAEGDDHGREKDGAKLEFTRRMTIGN